MQQRTWYVTLAGAPVDWAQVVTAGRTTEAIYKITDQPGTTNFIRTLWCAADSRVTAAAQLAAAEQTSTDPIPQPPTDLNSPAVLKVTAGKVTAGRQWDFEETPTVDGAPLSNLKRSDLDAAFVQRPTTTPTNGQVLIWDGSAGKAGAVDRVGLSGGVEKLATQTAAVGAYTVDPAKGPVHRIALGTQTTLSFVNPPAGASCTITLVLVQDAAGGRLVVWPNTVKWAGGVAPTMATTSNAVNVVTLLSVDQGATWYGFLSGADLR